MIESELNFTFLCNRTQAWLFLLQQTCNTKKKLNDEELGAWPNSCWAFFAMIIRTTTSISTTCAKKKTKQNKKLVELEFGHTFLHGQVQVWPLLLQQT
jgi:hypothetical protein